MIETPETVKNYAVEKMNGIKNIELFNSSKCSWLFDIWVAGHFGTLFNDYVTPCSVEVDEFDKQTYFDFKLHVKGETLPFQATEAMEWERKRGLEFKKGESIFDQEYWQSSSIEPYEYVGAAIDKKLKKYGSGAKDVNLVVYANIFGFDEEYEEVTEFCSRSITQFKSVWLFSSYVFGALFESEKRFYKQNNWIKLNG